MQGGDIGVEYGRSIVVVLDQLLVHTSGASGKQVRARMHLTKKRRQEADAETYTTNDNMLQWVLWFCRSNSIHCRVWSFLPEPTFDQLCLPIAKVIGNYVTEWVQFDDTHLAYEILRSDLDILTVYDADLDRVQTLWHFRGCHVQTGSTP